jgi:hypothetical protein
LANLALWLARPTGIRFSQVIIVLFNGDSWKLLHRFAIRPFLPTQRDWNTVLTRDDLVLAQRFVGSLDTLQQNSAVWIAVRTISEALTDDWWESRYLFLWVALEALFGPKDAREINYRLALRISIFLSDSKELSRSIFRAVKMGYGWRSKVVHGVGPKDQDPEVSDLILCVVKALLRRSLHRILLEDGMMQRFTSKGREDYLDNLVFDGGQNSSPVS